MARVRMVMDVSGLRGGTEDSLGFPWPQHGEFLDCDEAEAASLIAAGIAEPAPASARAARTEPVADDETAEAPAPVRTRTAPRPRAGQ